MKVLKSQGLHTESWIQFWLPVDRPNYAVVRGPDGKSVTVFRVRARVVGKTPGYPIVESTIGRIDPNSSRLARPETVGSSQEPVVSPGWEGGSATVLIP